MLNDWYEIKSMRHKYKKNKTNKKSLLRDKSTDLKLIQMLESQRKTKITTINIWLDLVEKDIMFKSREKKTIPKTQVEMSAIKDKQY